MDSKNLRWDHEAEVVILGYGGAGAVTAMTAHDAGASVLMLERQPANKRNPSTYMSGSSIISPSDVEGAITHMKALYEASPGLYETDPEVLRAWAEYCSQNVKWVEANGGSVTLFSKVGEHHNIPGYESIQNYRFDMIDHPTPWGLKGYGYGLFTWLSGLVAERKKIDIMYEVRGHRLLTNGKGEVVGIQAKQGDKTINVRATRGVVLTTGGFEFNDWMKLQFLRVHPTYFYANPDNTGDGVIMAQELGAALWHMSACSAKAIARFPEFPTGFPINFWGYAGGMSREDTYGFPMGYIAKDKQADCGAMQVDRDGKRFTNEVWKQHTQYYELTVFDSQRSIYPRVPCFWIFDQLRMNAGQLVLRETGAGGPLQMYAWSHDNMTELEKGWITKGDTIEELARKLDLDPDNLKQTLTDYNEACETGKDEFGRAKHTLVPLTGPFYAMRLWPGGPNTQGGPQRNARAQVVNVNGEAIPRLYSAGELGSIYGMLYPVGGGNIAECIAFGRIAGENVAQEPRA